LCAQNYGIGRIGGEMATIVQSILPIPLIGALKFRIFEIVAGKIESLYGWGIERAQSCV